MGPPSGQSIASCVELDACADSPCWTRVLQPRRCVRIHSSSRCVKGAARRREVLVVGDRHTGGSGGSRRVGGGVAWLGSLGPFQAPTGQSGACGATSTRSRQWRPETPPRTARNPPGVPGDVTSCAATPARQRIYPTSTGSSRRAPMRGQPAWRRSRRRRLTVRGPDHRQIPPACRHRRCQVD